MAADIWELLSTKLGAQRFHLVGHDWGGPVAPAYLDGLGVVPTAAGPGARAALVLSAVGADWAGRRA